MRALASVSSILTSFYSKLLLALLVSIPLSTIVGDWLYAPLAGQALAGNSGKIAAEFEGTDLSPDEVLHSMNKLGLSWLYVTDVAGNVAKPYRTFAPDLPKYASTTRLVNWHNQRYYEVTAVENNRVIHAGYRLEPLSDLFHGLPVPAGYALLIILMSTGATAACFFVCVSGPLSRLPARVQKVFNGTPVAASDLGSTVLVASEIRNVDEQIIALTAEAQSKVTKEIVETRRDLKDVIARERQQRFINRLAHDLQQLDSSERVCQETLHKVQDRFPAIVKVGLCYRVRDGILRLSGQFGLTGEQGRAVRKLEKCDALNRSRENGLASFVQGRIAEIPLPKDLHITNTFIAPLVHHGQHFGILLFFMDADESVFESMQPILKDVAEATGKVLPNLVAYEAEVESNRTDDLTGITKLKYLNHYLDKLTVQIPPSEQITALLIEGDGFMALNEKYGKNTGDLLIKELCKMITAAVCPNGFGQSMVELQSTVFRYSAAQFLAIVRHCDGKKAQMLAERMRKHIEQYQSWPGGVPGWTVSVGIASMPDHVKDISLLVPEAEIARDYLKQNRKPNSICVVDSVPRAFRQKRQGNELGGTLNIFNPCALLQSIANAKRTGLLDVVSPDGAKMTLYLEVGEARKARLKRLAGDDAIVEFVSTFKEGNFDFREFRDDAASQSVAELTGFGDKFDVVKPLEALLLDGSLGADHIEMAKRAIPPGSMYVIKEKKADDVNAWVELSNLAEPPSQREVTTMKDILKHGVGGITLNDLIATKVDNVPSHVAWRAAHYLLEHKFIKLSPVKMLATF